MAKNGSDGKIDRKVNAKMGDIYTAAKSLAEGTDYSKGGYPAHDSLHINKNNVVKAGKGEK